MNDERLRILEMVGDGTITVDEADQLLAALEPREPDPAVEDRATSITILPPGESAGAPDMKQFRRYWEYPVIVGAILLGVAGLCISNTSATLLQLCGWTLFAGAVLVIVVGWFSQWSPWLHVRIRERGGSRIAFSLPLPLPLARSGLNAAQAVVHRYSGPITAANLATAASLLELMEDMPSGEPLTIEVDEEDGDHIRIYVG